MIRWGGIGIVVVFAIAIGLRLQAFLTLLTLKFHALFDLG